MDLQRLRGFYWTAQLGSVSGAAQMINVSQSAISHQLRSLEEELGTKLYERSRRGIVLTTDGERLVRYARLVVHTVDDLQSEFSEIQGRPHGTVRIAAFRGIATHSLPAIVKRFHQAHPRVRLDISSRAFDSGTLQQVADGQADLGITASWNEFGDLRYLEYTSFDMFACTCADHPWAGRTEPLTLAELAAKPLVLYEKGTAIRQRLDRVFDQESLQPQVPISVGGSQALLEFVKIGLGVGIVSGLVAGPERDPDLHVIPVSELFG
ncbi:MAG: LysR family transcriptional regulator, partial [Candidatus Krumholzibacteriota bacterium]